MSSDFFNELVKIVEDINEIDNPYELIERQCKSLGKTPEQLQPDDGALMAIQLLSEASEYLPQKTWVLLDTRVKDLLSEGQPLRSKVRGILLNNTIDYIRVKKGLVGVNEISASMRLPPRFKPESWYSLSLLEDMLSFIDSTVIQNGRSRSRDVGEYVISPKVLLTGHYWFGKGQENIAEAFENLSEILALENYSHEANGNKLYKIKFEGVNNTCSHEFMMGICEGILKVRNTSANPFELKCDNGSTVISIGLTDSEEVIL
ncbi:MAG: hypothetical protein KAJ33_06975 [Thermoplasmata archaeon]|nr:hypothetical protein [Thermoplasmata archaeon]